MARSWIAFLAASTLAGLLAGAASARSDEEVFDKLIGRYAVDVGNGLPSPLKPRTACVCTSLVPPQPGFLEIVPLANQLDCGVPSFDADGKLQLISDCTQFEVIGR